MNTRLAKMYAEQMGISLQNVFALTPGKQHLTELR